MRKLRPGFVLAIGLLITMSAHAQDKSQDDVVVTGHKPLDTQAARRFVNEITAATQGQIARFDAAVCPLAIGFTPEFEQQIVARIRKVAKAVGAEVAGRGCRGNVVLVATDEGGALVQGLRASRPDLFQGTEPVDIDRLVKGAGPVRSWAATALVNEDGKRLATPRSGNLQDPPTLEVKSVSIVNPSSMRVIDASTVVVDSSAIPGKTLIQLADYAAMRALARTRPIEGGIDGVGTILSLFDPAADTPLSVTETDVAYLKALYAMPGNRTLSYQASRIAKGVKDASTSKR